MGVAYPAGFMLGQENVFGLFYDLYTSVLFLEKNKNKIKTLEEFAGAKSFRFKPFA